MGRVSINPLGTKGYDSNLNHLFPSLFFGIPPPPRCFSSTEAFLLHQSVPPPSRRSSSIKAFLLHQGVPPPPISEVLPPPISDFPPLPISNVLSHLFQRTKFYIFTPSLLVGTLFCVKRIPS
ncbi:hypothetical protein H6P81_010537 [Aristolochia fimbriata]|uniref:Uncharacterized protein n=1 Tax=Aristolochia fimbriata TaxID=158543 RepID=A0AAV7ESD3_ARIFI|nr:hypothetical protein H6P81_010537 [Aristolochia fimbriata]